MLDYITYSKKVKQMELVVCEDDEKKSKYIAVTDGQNRILLSKLKGYFAFKKFLIEAVLLRLTCPKPTLKAVREVYCNLANTLIEKEKEIEKILH